MHNHNTVKESLHFACHFVWGRVRATTSVRDLQNVDLTGLLTPLHFQLSAATRVMSALLSTSVPKPHRGEWRNRGLLAQPGRMWMCKTSSASRTRRRRRPQRRPHEGSRDLGSRLQTCVRSTQDSTRALRVARQSLPCTCTAAARARHSNRPAPSALRDSSRRGSGSKSRRRIALNGTLHP
jgi:hypothetical protein